MDTPLLSLISKCHVLFTDLWIKTQTIVFGCASAKFRRTEVHCFHIVCGINSSSMHLTKFFWWSANQDQGVFKSSTSICKKVISGLISLVNGIHVQGGGERGRGGRVVRKKTYTILWLLLINIKTCGKNEGFPDAGTWNLNLIFFPIL